MINLYYFTDRGLQVAFNLTLESHHINHANSQTIIKPNYAKFGIEVQFNIKIVEEFYFVYARLNKQHKITYQTVFSARFDKQDENNQVLDETEILPNLNYNHNLTETDVNRTDIKSPLEHQIQQQEMKESGWRIDKIYSRTIYFYKIGEMISSSHVKYPLACSAILKIEEDDKYCFTWSILAGLHPCRNSHPKKVSNYGQYFNELNIEGFDFTNGFKCSDVHIFEKLNFVSKNIFESNFYPDQKNGNINYTY